MGREEENRWPWRGQAALARPTPIWASGAALGGQHGGVYFPSGTKGQQPLVFPALARLRGRAAALRSEEHTSELQSLMRISYAVFCLKKKTLTYFFYYSLTTMC